MRSNRIRTISLATSGVALLQAPTAANSDAARSPLGAPGCSVYTNTVYGCYPQAASGGASSMSWSVPNDPNLFGFEISAQSACAAADPANTLTFSTSNGLRATAGH